MAYNPLVVGSEEKKTLLSLLVGPEQPSGSLLYKIVQENGRFYDLAFAVVMEAFETATRAESDPRFARISPFLAAHPELHYVDFQVHTRRAIRQKGMLAYQLSETDKRTILERDSRSRELEQPDYRQMLVTPYIFKLFGVINGAIVRLYDLLLLKDLDDPLYRFNRLTKEAHDTYEAEAKVHGLEFTRADVPVIYQR